MHKITVHTLTEDTEIGHSTEFKYESFEQLTEEQFVYYISNFNVQYYAVSIPY